MGNRTNAELNKEIGTKLQKARLSKRITQFQIAEHVGMSINHISAIERGINKASIEVLIGYCETLNMSASEILGI